MVKWLKHHDGNQHGLFLKPTSTILLCPSEKYLTAPSPAW